MSNVLIKKVSDSITEHVQIIMPGDTNGNGRLFGGRLAEWIDVVAAVVARRHSGRDITTVCMDNLNFKAPAYANETIVLVGRVTFVGRTSMEIRVDTYAENLSGEHTNINTAYVVMVALDENETPFPVPALSLETDEHRLDWEAGQKRHELRKFRRLEDF